MDRKLNHIKNHYIICGYGRIGRVLCRHLEGNSIEIVVMDNSPELIPIMNEDNVLYVAGDASDEKNLTKAGIQRAKGLAAALGSDAENVFLVLTARQLNPDLFIVARAGDAKSKDKLKAAGANYVSCRPHRLWRGNRAGRSAVLAMNKTDF